MANLDWTPQRRRRVRVKEKESDRGERRQCNSGRREGEDPGGGGGREEERGSRVMEENLVVRDEKRTEKY